jgi:hypothetical protein
MGFIPTREHGLIDYVGSIVLFSAPWILNFFRENVYELAPISYWTPAMIGIVVIFYSLITDYELALTGVIPMGGHIAMDVISGIFLALSPWLFGFSKQIFVPHLVAGVFMIVFAICTKRTPKEHPDRTPY